VVLNGYFQRVFFRLRVVEKRLLGHEVDAQGRKQLWIFPAIFVVVSSIPSFVQLTAAGGDGAMWEIGVVEAAKISGHHSESELLDGDKNNGV
jgi:hypothetical protein